MLSFRTAHHWGI
jgi:hypothetical protein